MGSNNLRNPYFQITTYRDNQAVVIETTDTEVAARARFNAAVDLCTALRNARAYKVELRGTKLNILDRWPDLTGILDRAE